MNIDLCIYRARTGMHRYRLLQAKGVKYFNNFELFVFLAMILYRAGDVEKNPGPENGLTRAIHHHPQRFQFSMVIFLFCFSECTA